MNKVLDYLHLRDVGGLEFLIAFFPILIGYTVAGLPMGIVLCTILVAGILLTKGVRKALRKNPIWWFFLFMVFHDLIWLVIIDNAKGVFFNSLIGQCAYVVAAIVVGNVIDYKKFRGSYNWVSLLCMGGMLYHYSLVLRGMQFNPIMLPFMPEQDLSSRLFNDYERPTSFFLEAQSYASFMLITLFMALVEKKFIWALLVSVTIFMSSSTTGLVTVFIIFAMVAFSGFGSKKQSGWSIIIFLVLGAGMLFLLLNTSFFEQGTSKMLSESENLGEEIRIVQGPLLVGSMDFGELIFGVPYANPYQYCVAKGILSDFIVYGENSMYVPTIWLMIVRYGIVGLMLYLNVYWYFFKRDKSLRPFIICLFITLFSNPDFVGGVFSSCMFFIIAYYRFYSNENNTYRIRVR